MYPIGCTNETIPLKVERQKPKSSSQIRKYVDGHAWVVDGCIDEVKNGKQYYYVHCNWGWGYSQNGYYRSDILNADPGTKPVYNDSVVKTRGQNFRYKLETATFRK